MWEYSMQQKLLTLIVPTYNMEAYLPICLDSVTADEVPDTLEVIVVNDGSRDRSLEIMKQYQVKRPDIIRIIDKENGNYGSCFNAGLAIATGKYCRLLDADDRFDTAGLVALLEKMKTCEADVIVTPIVEEYYNEGVKVNELLYSLDTVLTDTLYKLEDFDVQAHAHQGAFRMHGITYKTSVLRESGLHLVEGISYTDVLYVFIPYSWARTMIAYDIYLYHYRLGREGQTMSSHVMRKSLNDIMVVMDVILQEFDKTSQDEHLKNNQRAIVQGSTFPMFLGVLKRQRRLYRKDYATLRSIIRHIKKYNLYHKYLYNRWYYCLWRKTENSWVLDWALRLRHFGM